MKSDGSRREGKKGNRKRIRMMEEETEVGEGKRDEERNNKNDDGGKRKKEGDDRVRSWFVQTTINRIECKVLTLVFLPW
jgi:hypothetical protein